MDQITVRFSEPVHVRAHHLRIGGPSQTEEPTFTKFDASFGPTGGFQAVWTLARPLRDGPVRLRLDGSSDASVTDRVGQRLDGEWVDAASRYPPGDERSGGDFAFRFNLMAGDADGSAKIDGFDLTLLLDNWARRQPQAHPRADLTADGRVDSFDLALVLAGWGSALVGLETSQENYTLDVLQVQASASRPVERNRPLLGISSFWSANRPSPVASHATSRPNRDWFDPDGVIDLVLLGN